MSLIHLPQQSRANKNIFQKIKMEKFFLHPCADAAESALSPSFLKGICLLLLLKAKEGVLSLLQESDD